MKFCFICLVSIMWTIASCFIHLGLDMLRDSLVSAILVFFMAAIFAVIIPLMSVDIFFPRNRG